MKYIKEFQNHTAYVAFTGTSEYVLPNVSLCDQENEVHFNPEAPAPSGPSIATFEVTSTNNPTRILHTTSGISGVEIDGVEQPTIETGYTFSTTGEHTVKYTFSANTTYDNWELCTNLVSMNISNSIVTIGKNAFQYCLSLRTVTIPNSVTSIGESAFQYCSSLTSITVNRTTPSALGIGAFDNTKNCPIYVPCESVNTYKSTSVWSTYSTRIQCVTPPQPTTAITYTAGSKLNVDLTKFTPAATGHSFNDGVGVIEFASDVTEIGDYTFNGCSSLTSIDIPSSVTRIGWAAFYQCSGLTSVTIPDSVTSIEFETFQLCTSFTSIGPKGSGASVEIPNSVTSIGQIAFCQCYNLTSVTIPNSVTSIGPSAFDGCSGLTSIDIPDNVTSIGNGAFQRCPSLTSVTIGNGVTSIGNIAFSACTSLTSITVNAVTPPTLGSYAFDSTNNCPIYVPAESVETYMSTYGWNSYYSRIKPKP